jgi:hypothetical protein
MQGESRIGFPGAASGLSLMAAQPATTTTQRQLTQLQLHQYQQQQSPYCFGPDESAYQRQQQIQLAFTTTGRQPTQPTQAPRPFQQQPSPYASNSHNSSPDDNNNTNSHNIHNGCHNQHSHQHAPANCCPAAMPHQQQPATVAAARSPAFSQHEQPAGPIVAQLQPQQQQPQPQASAGVGYHRPPSSQFLCTSSDHEYLHHQVTSQNLALKQHAAQGQEQLGKGAFLGPATNYQRQAAAAHYTLQHQHQHQHQRRDDQLQMAPAGGCQLADYAQPPVHQDQQPPMAQIIEDCQAESGQVAPPPPPAGQHHQLQLIGERARSLGTAGAAFGAQPRPRVNSISATRREPTPTTLCSPNQASVAGGLTRSFSFSATGAGAIQPLGRSTWPQPVPPPPSSASSSSMMLNGGELCCAPQADVANTGHDDHQMAGESAHYYDTYGGHQPMHLVAPGSMSSNCSSIGSPVPAPFPGEPAMSPQQMATVGQQQQQLRPISSNSSSCDAPPTYYSGQQQQLQTTHPNGGGGHQMLQRAHHQKSGAGNTTTTITTSSTTTSSCGSSIISTSDSLSMSINLEQYISKRNERERSRVRNVNDAFDHLKNSLPLDVEKMSKRMSKVEILRTAIGYIRNLEQVLGNKQQLNGHGDGFKSRHGERQVSPATAKRLFLSCNQFRRAEAHQQHVQQQHARNRHHSQHHHHHSHHQYSQHHQGQNRHRRQQTRSNGERGECQDAANRLARLDASPGKMTTIKRDDEDDDEYVGSKDDDYDEGHEMMTGAESDQDKADGNIEASGDGYSSCMDDRSEDY